MSNFITSSFPPDWTGTGTNVSAGFVASILTDVNGNSGTKMIFNNY